MHWRETLPDWYIKKYGYQPCVNIGTSGHVDHGKTSLIQALTGSWTSVHSQELKRGITIRVGYSDAAFYKCKSCEEPLGYSTTPKCNNCGDESELSRVVSFVDSPGHESLMANMLSGSALMDGALLLVAANEQVPKPQTKEHLLALQTLGIQQIVVLQNKVDLVAYDEVMTNYKDITKFVKGTNAAKSPIIPISAQSGLNLDALIGAIESSIKTPERDEKADPVMHVLRSFDVNKPGIKLKDIKGGVIGGSLTQGIFNVGDEIEIVGIRDTSKTTCTGVEMFRKLLDSGEAGDNIGALLRGVDREGVERGQVLCKPGSVQPHTKFEAEAYILTKEEGGRHTPFFANYRPQFYFRTTDVTGTVVLPSGTEMVMPGDNLKFTVELIAPIAMEDKLRFAIREGGRTVGSGVVSKILE